MPLQLNDAFSPPRNHRRYCTQCRVAEDDLEQGEDLLQCVRCRSALYCSRSCQMKNWSTHKTMCKQIQKAWVAYESADSTLQSISGDDAAAREKEARSINEKLRVSSNLAMTLIDFAYFSTDTFERGAYICEKAMRILIWCTKRSLQRLQNVQCLLVLAACLHYDDGALKIIALLNHVHKNAIAKYSPTELEEFFRHIHMDELNLASPTEYEGPAHDLVYTCLLLIRMRQLAEHRDGAKQNSSIESCRSLEEDVSVVIEVCVKKCRWIFDCLPVDGDPLVPEASKEMFGLTSCWLLIQDCFALTPGVIHLFLEYSPNTEEDDYDHATATTRKLDLRHATADDLKRYNFS